MKPMRIEVYKDELSEWRWRLKSSNGKIIATSSEGYKRRSSCTKMAEKISGSRFELAAIPD